MKFGFTSAEAIQQLKDLISQNMEMTDVFNKASECVSDAFSLGGDVVTGDVGTACAACWGDGSSDYFKKKLLKQTEIFIHDKVEKIIGLASDTTSATKNTYNNGMKA